MNANDLAQWMHDEHEKVHELTARLLEATVAIPRIKRSDWLARLRERFEHLRAHQHQHMALEERDGYLPSVSQKRPTLSGEVDRLQHEHQELILVMDGIRKDLNALTENDQLLIRDCCRRIENLIGFIESHEQDENLIVLSVFTDDIGTKD